MHCQHQFPLDDVVFCSEALGVFNNGFVLVVDIDEIGEIGAFAFDDLSFLHSAPWPDCVRLTLGGDQDILHLPLKAGNLVRPFQKFQFTESSVFFGRIKDFAINFDSSVSVFVRQGSHPLPVLDFRSPPHQNGS